MTAAQCVSARSLFMHTPVGRSSPLDADGAIESITNPRLPTTTMHIPTSAVIAVVSLALASSGLMVRAASEAERNLRLPSTDTHYNEVNSYVEDVPDADYRHASETAHARFRGLKYGVRVHWGPYSIWGESDASWPFLKMSDEKRQEYQELYRTWNPTGFSAEEWTELFVAAGARMFAITTKHHDGFSMFDTKTRVTRRVNWTAPGGPRLEDCDLAYGIMETPFRRDVIKELCEAARRHGLKIDLYFSHPDWYDADFRPYNYHPLQTPSAAELAPNETELRRLHRPSVVVVPDPSPEETGRMVARHRAQIRELLTNYGKIDMMCLDQWFGPKVWPELKQTIRMIRELQPDVMLRARGIGNYGDYYTPEGFVPGAKENTNMPWFVIYPLADGRFSYEADGSKYKGARWIVRSVVDTVAKGGNFMVAIGPDGNGRFHPAAVAQLREAGRWLKENAEAIYPACPREGDLWKEGDAIRYTRTPDGRAVYAFSLDWPGEHLTLRTVKPAPGARITLVGRTEPLAWQQTDEGLVIILPSSLRPTDTLVCAFRIPLE